MNISRLAVLGCWTGLLAACLPMAAAAEAPPAHSAVTPVPRDASWMPRHEAINQRAKEGNVDLLFLGDSITAGWNNAGAEVWKKHYGSRRAMNAGIGGDRTQHVLWRLDNGNIEGLNPKLAVLMIGTNNSGDNTSQEIADGVRSIVEKLRAKLPETKVLVLGIFPRGENVADKRRQVNVGANKLIEPLADGSSVLYLDISDKFLSDDGSLSREIMPDLLHLSPQGYQIWADAIEPTVSQIMGDSSS